MDYTNKPRAMAIEDKDRTLADRAYHENIKGKVKSKCVSCGRNFWSEKPRKVCSVECLRSMP